MMRPAPAGLPLPDGVALADLATLVGRARTVDPDGAARLRIDGGVLAVYVCPILVPGALLVLGLRTMHLAAPGELDVTVGLARLADSCAAASASTEGGIPASEMPVVVPLPAGRVSVPWAGVSPPRSGWAPAGEVEARVLLEAARAGAAEIAAGTPPSAGSAAVARLRALVWGRPLAAPGTDAAASDAVPAGMAFAADVLGFVRDGDPPAPVHRVGVWSRLTAARGYLLARAPTLAPPS
jgi:hypothetical protein